MFRSAHRHMTKENLGIYNDLKDKIVTLSIHPGDILKEVDVAKKYNVSRTPIRDVLKKLEGDGLLEVHSQQVTYVTKIDLSGITDIMYIRYMVEVGVLKELIKVVTPGDIAEFRRILAEQKKLVDKNKENNSFVRDIFANDNLMHQRMYHVVGKESILERLNSSWPFYSRFRSLSYLRSSSYLSMLYDIHSRMVGIIEDKDESQVPEICRQHNFSGLVGIEDVEAKYPSYFK